MMSVVRIQVKKEKKATAETEVGQRSCIQDFMFVNKVPTFSLSPSRALLNKGVWGRGWRINGYFGGAGELLLHNLQTITKGNKAPREPAPRVITKSTANKCDAADWRNEQLK